VTVVFHSLRQVLHETGAQMTARTLAGSTGLLLACRRGHTIVVDWWLAGEVSECSANNNKPKGKSPHYIPFCFVFRPFRELNL
jgi:ankyrin repeat protein